MLAKPIGATLVVDDVATSGYHMEEAIKALRSLAIPAMGVAWVSAESATIGRPDWRDGRRRQEAQACEPEAISAWEVGRAILAVAARRKSTSAMQPANTRARRLIRWCSSCATANQPKP
jgi:hypothetical protein